MKKMEQIRVPNSRMTIVIYAHEDNTGFAVGITRNDSYVSTIDSHLNEPEVMAYCKMVHTVEKLDYLSGTKELEEIVKQGG